MKVYINGQLIDQNSSPIVIVFDTDYERLAVGQKIMNMEPTKGLRYFAISNKELLQETQTKLFQELDKILGVEKK